MIFTELKGKILAGGSGLAEAAILTGMRKSNLLNLKWTEYKRDSRRLYFYEKKKGKMTDKILDDDMIQLLESIPRGETNTSLPRLTEDH